MQCINQIASRQKHKKAQWRIGSDVYCAAYREARSVCYAYRRGGTPYPPISQKEAFQRAERHHHPSSRQQYCGLAITHNTRSSLAFSFSTIHFRATYRHYQQDRFLT